MNPPSKRSIPRTKKRYEQDATNLINLDMVEEEARTIEEEGIESALV